MTAVISNRVAEKALCWWEGRNCRSSRVKPWAGRPSGESAEFAIQGRFYTQTLRSPHAPDGSPASSRCGACKLAGFNRKYATSRHLILYRRESVTKATVLAHGRARWT